jgi:glutathione S-transferase
LRGLPVKAEIVEDRTTKFKASLIVFNKILGKQKYMGGDEFSLVDIFYLPLMQKLYVVGLGGLIDEQENVKAWWERVSTRESWKRVNAYTGDTDPTK